MFGILALQGGFALHQRALEQFAIPSILLTKPEELKCAEALIIPGGESTALLTLMQRLHWAEAIQRFCKGGKLIFGTCAGLIVLSRPTPANGDYLGLIDIEVKRNAYGRCVDRFVVVGTSLCSLPSLEMVCIRAPEITFVGQEVEVLASLGKRPMLLRQNNVVVATFHPELSQQAPFYHWLQKLSLSLLEAR